MRRHVYFYTHLPTRFADAAAVLAGDPGLWLPPPATPDGTAWRVVLDAGRALPGPLTSKLATVEVGPAVDRDIGLLLQLRWTSTGSERLFPVLTADLELAPLNGEGCQLSLIGSYRPPLAAIGGATDRLLGHRVAEACVRRFVMEVADRVESAALTH